MAFEVALLLYIALILLGAKILGEIAERLGFSALIGEVLAGVIFGPLLGIIKPDPFLDQVAGLGILFLLFIIGMNVKIDDIKKDSYKGGVLALAGAGLSFIAGFAVGFFSFNSINIGFFLGIAVMSSSTLIGSKTLRDAGEIKTRVHEMALAIDMADKVIAILALSLLTTYFTYGGVQIWNVAILFFVLLGLFVVITTIGSSAVTKFLSLFKTMNDEQMLVSISLVIVFILAFLTEQVGIASVTGAFLAGIAISKSHMAENVIMPKVKIIGHGFFIPIFFAYSAVLMNLGSAYASLSVIIILVVVGVLAKVIGSGYASKLYKMSPKEGLRIGVSMVPRGEFAIVISQVALTASIISNSVYTTVMIFVIITIILTPILMKFVGGNKNF